MLRVCGYTRVSTKRIEQGESLENQIEYFTQLIGENPEWTFAGIYADKDSGESAKKRKDFQKMLTDCEKGKIDLIVTKNCKRFARNIVECLEIVRRLRKINVGVYFESEQINTLTTNEEFFLVMAETVAEHELKSHSLNVKIGIQYLFERGESLQSIRVLGYERDGIRGLKVVPEEAELVKRIFNLYVSGLGANTIAKQLNAEGQKTIEGLPYKHFTVLYIIENEKYAGNCILQKVYKKNYTDYINKGEVNKYVVYGTHEAIIDQATWDKAQEVRAKNVERTKKKRKYSNPFKNHIVCGSCGLSYLLSTNNPKSDSIVYTLKCYGRSKNGAGFCHNKPIRLETMKKLFIKMHNELVKNKQIIIPKQTVDEGIIQLQGQINELRERADKFLELEAKGLLSENAMKEYRRLIEHLATLEDEKLERCLRETNNSVQHQQSKELEKYIRTANPLVKFDEWIFKSMVARIVVIHQEKVRFVLVNDQEVEIGYQLGKYQHSDIV